MKRVIKLSLIVILAIICLTGVVYAAPSCNIEIQTSKTEFDKNEQFTVDINLSNIKSERGIVAIEATLDYDKESLVLVEMKGQNEWSNPIKDLSYNESTGKFVIDKNGLAKSNETILKLTFKVKETSKKNLTISLKDIKVSDATVPGQIALASKNITIKEGTVNPQPLPPVDPKPVDPTPVDPKPVDPTPVDPKPTEPTNSQTPTTNSTNKDNIANGKIPQTGNDNRIFMIFTAVAIIAGVVLYVKMKIVNKQMGE